MIHRPRTTIIQLPWHHGGRRAGSRGQALVELALIVPLLLVLVAAAGDLARVFAARISIESAARSGAMEASLHPTSYVPGSACSTLSNRVMCAVLTESAGGAAAVTPADVSMTCLDTYLENGRWRHRRLQPCSELLGSLVEVTVVGHVQLLTPILAPFMGGQSFDTTATATAQIAVRPNIAGTTATPAPTPGFTPLPIPTATPTPEPGATPTPEPTADPTPTPTPFCPPPVANFTVDPTTGRKGNWGHGTLFRFTDLSTTTPLCPLTWSWNFGDGGGATSISTEMNPTHTYQTQSGQGNNPGAFQVVLVASNAGGSSSFSRPVTVTP